MAVLPILEQKHSKIIIKTLLKKQISVKDLNEYLISLENIDISTATLYRRVKELFLAGLILKQENGTYLVTEHGKTAYSALYGTKKSSVSNKGSNTALISQLGGKESYILLRLQKKQYNTSGLLTEISISPNYLIDLLEKLTRLNLIKVVEDQKKKKGRPKKFYKLTPLGKLILKEIEELKTKLSWKK